MIKYNGIIKKSRTLDKAALVSMVGTALALLPQLQSLITPKEFGIALVVLSLWDAYLRAKTSTPLGQKDDTGDQQ